MMSAPSFPHDANGDVLRRMFENGDDLSQPRMIDFSFVFPERKQALAFAEVLDAPDLEVCISHYKARAMWQAMVKRQMLPTHEAISKLELALSTHARSTGGEPDGWGCMQISRKD